MANDVVGVVVFWGQLHYKLLKDLGVSIFWWPVLSTLYLRGEEIQTGISIEPLSIHPSIHPSIQLKPSTLTLFPSSQRETMTMMEVCCSQIILQKLPTVSSFGPTTHAAPVRMHPNPVSCTCDEYEDLTLSCYVLFGFLEPLWWENKWNIKNRSWPPTLINPECS